MGAGRREHHRREQAKRDAAQEANRIRRIQEEADARMRAMAEAMRPTELENIQAPRSVRSTLDDARGIRTARSTRGTVKGLSRGLAALRIPLNIGGDSGGGLNIG